MVITDNLISVKGTSYAVKGMRRIEEANMIRRITEEDDHISTPQQAIVRGWNSVNPKSTSQMGRFMGKMCASGRRAYRFMEQQERIIPEMASQCGVLLFMNPAYKVQRAYDCAERLVEALLAAGPEEHVPDPVAPPVPRMVMSPHRAIERSESGLVLSRTAGHIEAAPVGVYPLGLYVLRPGQLVDDQTVSYLEQALSAGATVHGMVDNEIPIMSSFETKPKPI